MIKRSVFTVENRALQGEEKIVGKLFLHHLEPETLGSPGVCVGCVCRGCGGVCVGGVENIGKVVGVRIKAGLPHRRARLTAGGGPRGGG